MTSSEKPIDHILLLTEYELKKKALEEAKDKFEELTIENRRLTEERDASHQETYETTEFLRRDLQEKASTIEQLKKLVQETREETKTEIVNTKKEAQETIATAQQMFRTKEEELESKIQDLQRELCNLQSFRTRQKEIEEVLFNFQSEKNALEEQNRLTKCNMEKNFFEETNRLRDEFKHQLTQQKLIAHTEHEKYLDDRTKQILKQNRRLAMEISLHKQETLALHRELTLSENERTRLDKELQFCMGLEQSYAERNAKQGRQLKVFKSKSEALEQSMKQLVINMNKANEESRRKTERQIQDLQFEVEGLRKLVKAKNRDCITMRHLAQQVLMQRKDVERFLLSSLQMVRMEKGSLELPQPERKTVDLSIPIEEMSWTDRERVLKLLLSKLKNGAKTKTEDMDSINGLLSKEGPAKPT